MFFLSGIKNDTEFICDSCLQEMVIVYIGTGRARRGTLEGDLVNGVVYCGAIVGMIPEVVSAGEIVRSIVKDSEVLINELNKFWP